MRSEAHEMADMSIVTEPPSPSTLATSCPGSVHHRHIRLAGDRFGSNEDSYLVAVTHLLAVAEACDAKEAWRDLRSSRTVPKQGSNADARWIHDGGRVLIQC